ncbi:MAG: sigma-54 dependent transcriptional regulator, partial [Pseudomonadota bacterium]
NIETAVSAIRKGAYDFVEKPFKSDRLILAVERALESNRLRRENEELRLRVGEEAELIGRSSAVNQLRQTITKVAPSNSRILIAGPPGAGKEVVGRQIHLNSRRKENSFVAINAASIAPDRMELELFGAEEGEGTARRIGVFEQAHGGTLFLDEVADMPLETQGKILRVLVDQTFQRVGGSQRVSVDVRVISSTSRDLRAEIADGRFREDLFHRLNVVPIKVPSLAERREDIPGLVDHFLDRLCAASGMARRKIGEDALAALQAHDWPGNVRQLRNNIERLLILANDEVSEISADLLPGDIGSSAPVVPSGQRQEHVISLPLREAREMFEREYLMAQINRFGGNISRTAAFIGMERSALHRKLKSLGVTSARGPEFTA